MSRNKARFYGEDLWALRPNPKLQEHPFSAVRDCLFNIFAAGLQIGGRSSNLVRAMPCWQGPTYHGGYSYNKILYYKLVLFVWLCICVWWMYQGWRYLAAQHGRNLYFVMGNGPKDRYRLVHYSLVINVLVHNGHRINSNSAILNNM